MSLARGASTNEIAQELRGEILRISHGAGLGHIGSNLSVVEMILAVRGQMSEDIDRGYSPRFVLSKGHASLADHVAFELLEGSNGDLLKLYSEPNSLYGTHPHPRSRHVEFGSGSLGQGIVFAVGLAVANRILRRLDRIYCLASDAEFNEGASWEALLSGARNADGITLLVDYNNQQAMGKGSSIVDLSEMRTAVESFGWWCVEVDGHDAEAIQGALKTCADIERPSVVVCRTISGRGVDFMEGQLVWHYRRLDDDLFNQALNSLDRGGES